MALGVVAFGVINVAGELKEIRVTAELEKQSFETIWNNPSFYSFNHRGKALFGEWCDTSPDSISATKFDLLRLRTFVDLFIENSSYI